jgi:hypothetical protein
MSRSSMNTFAITEKELNFRREITPSVNKLVKQAFFFWVFYRAEGSNILLDPIKVCKKTKKIPNKIAEICRQDSRNKTSLLKKITKGISLGFRECENQFRHRKWNCTSQRRSMKKILLRGEFTECQGKSTPSGITSRVPFSIQKI